MEEKKCLKCGRPCPEDQPFCGECQTEMEKYPVKPGVVVLLPQHEPVSRPAVRRRVTPPSPEEQVARLKKRLVALRIALLLSLAAAGVLGWFVATEYFEEDENVRLPGQNYSSETTAAPSETE